jgi:hypothetical protein
MPVEVWTPLRRVSRLPRGYESDGKHFRQRPRNPNRAESDECQLYLARKDGCAEDGTHRSASRF